MWLDFRWIEFNSAKIAEHGVTEAECEWVVQNVKPSRIGEKFVANGATKAGRRIRVVYIMDDRITAFVITAYPL